LKYFSYKTTEEKYFYICKKFLLFQSHSPFPEKLDNHSLAKHIFESSEELFPKKLLILLKSNQEQYDIFQNDIIEYLIFSTKVSNDITKTHLENHFEYLNNEIMALDTIYANKKKKKITKKTKSTKNANDTKKTKDENQDEGKKENKDVVSLLKHFRLRTAPYLGLPKIHYEEGRKNRERVYSIPSMLAPFISFIMYHNKEHKLFLNKKTLIEQTKDMAEYQGTLLLYSTDMPEYNKHLNIYLFEREYNLNLIKTIIDVSDSIFIDHANAKKVLSLLSLLPNLSGREFLVSILVEYLHLISKSDFHSGYGSVHFPKEKENTNQIEHENNHSQHVNETKWLVEVPSMILQLALVTFPVMESVYNFLYNLSSLEEETSQSFYMADALKKNMELSLLPIVDNPTLDQFNDLKSAIRCTNELTSSVHFREKLEKVSTIESIPLNSPNIREEYQQVYLEPLLDVASKEVMQALKENT